MDLKGIVFLVSRSRLLLALTALTLLAVLLLTSSPARAAFEDSDGDGAIDLAEEVFGSDPADLASKPENLDLLLLRSGRFACSDGVDNDLDGFADAADTGCQNADGGIGSDHTEIALGSDPLDDRSFPEGSRLDALLATSFYPYLTCADGQDNDGDGLIDAADPGCAPLDADGDGFDDSLEKTLGSDWQDAASEPEHASMNPGSCSDAADNDADGTVDSADDGCQAAPNDDLTDAVVVDSLPFSHGAKLAGITTEPGERQSSCSFADDTRATVWYQFTPPVATHAVIETTGSDFISSVSIWSEGLFGLTEVACNYSFPYFNTVPSRFAFAASAGETYYIQVERFVFEEVGGAFLDLGRLRFHMEATSPPAIDDFADAAPIESLPFTTSVDTVAAGTEPSEPDASCRFQGYPTNSVWYRLTPASDTYVFAEVIVGTDFGVTLGAYEGAALGALEQVACGDQLAFLARAGHTYYVQGAGYQCQRPGVGEGGVASICIDSRAGNLALRVDTFELPACPLQTFSMPDPRDDADDNEFPLDVMELSVSLGDEFVCITAEMDPPVAPPNPGMWLELDADLAGEGTGDTHRSHIFTACDYPTGFDYDRRVFVDRADEGLLARVSRLTGSGPTEAGTGFFAFDGSAATLILPLSSIGGDRDFRFALEIISPWHGEGRTYDCAPNGGHVACENGVCAFSPFRNGDANCGGIADSIDAAIVLQFGAGLVDALACPDAADVTGEGLIDSRDAALILQFGAGLLDRLPPVEPRF